MGASAAYCTLRARLHRKSSSDLPKPRNITFFTGRPGKRLKNAPFSGTLEAAEVTAALPSSGQRSHARKAKEEMPVAKAKSPLLDSVTAIRKMIPEDVARFSDKAFLPGAELVASVSNTVWNTDYPKELFQQYVLCPRVADEELCFQQQAFHKILWPQVRNARFASSVAQTVNRWCAAHARLVEGGTGPSADPWTVYRTGFGNSMELAIFVAYCMRCVGLAARVVSVPYWTHMDGGYAWVEFLDKRSWNFIEPCVPSPYYNDGWFQDILSTAMMIQVMTFGPTKSPLHGELVETIGNTTIYSQNGRYLRNTDQRSITIREGRNPADGATVRLQIINGGVLRTIAEIRSDSFGRVFFTTGNTRLWVTASKGGRTVEGVSWPNEDLWLNLDDPPAQECRWSEPRYNGIPDFVQLWKTLPEEQKQKEVELLANAASARKEWEKDLTAPTPGENLSKGCADLLDAARGNRKEIVKFLQEKGSARREKFLRSLPEKDLRTVSASLLESHFAALPQQNLPDGIYWRYVACPRIHQEVLFAWRDPNVLASKAASLTQAERTVLDLRLKGIPARLRPLDGTPERWEKNAFRPAVPEESGTLELSCKEELPDSLWSLSRFVEGECIPLDLSEYRWKNNTRTIPLPCGKYRLLVAARSPAGYHRYTMETFTIAPRGVFRTELPALKAEPHSWILSRKLPEIPAYHQQLHYVNVLATGKPSLFLFLEQLDGTTQRLLDDIKAHRLAFWRLWEYCYVFIPEGSPDRAKLSIQVESAFPGAIVLKGFFYHEAIVMAGCMGLELGKYPIAAFGEGFGEISYAQSGYQPGSADAEMLLAARRQCRGHDYDATEYRRRNAKPSWADEPAAPAAAASSDAPPKLDPSLPIVRKTIQTLQGNRPQTEGELLNLLQQLVDGVWRKSK